MYSSVGLRPIEIMCKGHKNNVILLVYAINPLTVKLLKKFSCAKQRHYFGTIILVLFYFRTCQVYPMVLCVEVVKFIHGIGLEFK